MADLIRGTTPSYIVDFTDSGVNVEDIAKATLTAKYRCVKTDLSDGLVLDPVENVIRYHFSQGGDIYVPWSEGEVSGAPWGATHATIHYDTVYDSEWNVISST